MGATLGSALQSPMAGSATRPSSSPWKATLWSPQAMWIPAEQGEAGICPCQSCRHSESSFGCRGHQGHHTWAVEIGTRARASCVLHIWGLSGDKGVAKEQWHIKKASVRHGQSLEHSRKHPAACLSHDKHSLGLELAQEHLQKGHPSLLTCVFSLNKHPLSLITSSSLEPIL